ncbi:TWiK family of potassium channels protein 7-like [Limulus polyphemus]|uniref:TWiK family of potassium channels protein 7-like n=1 Tax=Limulus polyphemus TaxID=6850 RepID=A0ABM1S6G9_LIMPO|nr:TWiK family of potassium channels protein 7-like [Limulus polyphemus]
MPIERKRSSRRSRREGHHPTKKRPPVNKCKTCCRKFTAFMFSHVGLCGLVVGYSIMGAFAFRALEAPYEKEKAGEVNEMREKMVKRLWDITSNYNILYRENWTRSVTSEIREFQSALITAVRDGYDGKNAEAGQQWSFSGAFLYSLTVITTIGYGNIAPKTNWGKMVTILYAIVGIPLMFLYLTNIGDLLAKSFKYVYRRLCRCKPEDGRRRHRHPEHYRVHHIVLQENTPISHGSLEASLPSKFGTPQPIAEEVKLEAIPDDLSEEGGYGKPRANVPIALCLAIITGYICGGAFLFSLWEGWNYLDGAYFCFVTLSTIGFGDLVPGDTVVSDTAGSQEKLVICSLYLLGGMALIAMCFNLVQEEVIYKMRKLGKRLGIVNDSNDSDD